MNGYIIEKYNNMDNAYTSRRLMEEAAKAGVDMCIIGACDTVSTEDGLTNAGRILEKRDITINRFKYGEIKNRLAALGAREINTAQKIDRYKNKAQQEEIFSDFMTNPRSVLAYAGTPLGEIASYVGFPFVAKGLCSSQGKEVFLIETKEQYEELCFRYGNEELLFQQLIETSVGRDLRIFAVRGEVIGCMVRKAKSGGFRANFALGAEVTEYNADLKIRNIALDIYAATRIEVLGIDLLFGKDGYVFCEINVTPGIQGIEIATGCNAAAAIINSAKQSI